MKKKGANSFLKKYLGTQDRRIVGSGEGFGLGVSWEKGGRTEVPEDLG